MSRSMIDSSNSTPSRKAMFARTACSLTLATPTNLIVIVPILGAGPLGASAASWAKSPDAAAIKINTKASARIIGLLGEVFKARNLLKES